MLLVVCHSDLVVGGGHTYTLGAVILDTCDRPTLPKGSKVTLVALHFDFCMPLLPQVSGLW